ncbi:MAG: peptidylprolyl isomerase [Pseudomonadales bacterium]|nr:peptidylprolyl isomerase [Pseudomonadales bacterium]MDG1443726.1 peptidylprolyl isomerase [Pseudomonadales bacterium]
MLKKIFSEPLLHFIFLSLVIFVAYGFLNPRQDNQQVIVVSEGRVAQISNSFRERWKRDPFPKELDGAIQAYAVNEMFIREAKALSLDADDQVIDQRLRKKMNYLLEDLADANRPTENALKQFYDNNAEKYRLPARYSFQQVLLSADREEPALSKMVLIQKKRIEQGFDPQGDTSMLPRDLTRVSTDQLARRFGGVFVDALADIVTQQWSGPVASAFGQHFVFIIEKESSEIQKFEAVKTAVLSDWQYDNNKNFQKDYEARLLQRYTIVVQGADSVSSDEDSNADKETAKKPDTVPTAMTENISP